MKTFELDPSRIPNLFLFDVSSYMKISSSMLLTTFKISLCMGCAHQFLHGVCGFGYATYGLFCNVIGQHEFLLESSSMHS